MTARKTSKTEDPFDRWRAWLDRTERQLNKALNEAMASREFGKVQGRFMEVLLNLQRSTNEATRRYFETLNLPTRADVLSLSEKLDQVDQRLRSLESAVGASSGAKASKKPRRTKRPPTAASTAQEPAQKKTAKRRTAKKKTQKKTKKRRSTKVRSTKTAKKKAKKTRSTRRAKR